MKIKRQISMGTLALANIVMLGEQVASADVLDDEISNAKKKGHTVNVKEINKKVKSKDELSKSQENENAHRLSESERLKKEISVYDANKAQKEKELAEYNKKVSELTREYTENVNKYKAEFERITKERNRILSESNATNKAIQDKYKAELQRYNEAVKRYTDEIVRIDREYNEAMGEYDRLLSEFKVKKDKAVNDYEKQKHDIEERNKQAQELYEKTKAEVVAYNTNMTKQYEAEKSRVKEENAKLKREYDNRVKDIRSENERKQKEYDEALKAWNDEKKQVESTVKTKEFTSGNLAKKIEDAKANGLVVQSGAEKVTEIDTGSESDAKRKAEELNDDEIKKLDASISEYNKKKAANDAYTKSIDGLKSDFGRLKNIKVNYVDGNGSADVVKLREKLEQARQVDRLIGKMKELNERIKAYDDRIKEQLKAAGLSDDKVNDTYNKKVTVDTSDLVQEYNNLIGKQGLSDSDIETFANKVNSKLISIKSSVDKAIKKAKAPETGTVVDEATYDSEVAKFRKEINKYDEIDEKIYGAENGFNRDFQNIYGGSTGYIHKGPVNVIKTTGDVTFYKGKTVTSISNYTTTLIRSGSPRNTDWEMSDALSFGDVGGDAIARVKLAKGASITFEYEFQDGSELKNNDSRQTITYKLVNGEKVKKNVKKIRYTLTNNGTVEPDGSGVFYIKKDLTSPFAAVYSPNSQANEVRPGSLLNISGEWAKATPMVSYKYEQSYHDEDGDRLTIGARWLDLNGDDASIVSIKDRKSSEYYSFNGVSYANLGESEPANWKTIEDEKSIKSTSSVSDETGTVYTNSAAMIRGKAVYDATAKGQWTSIIEQPLFRRYPPAKARPKLGYTLGYMPIEVMRTFDVNKTLDVIVNKSEGVGDNTVTVSPTKVVYKYKDVFDKPEPNKPVMETIPDETSVKYLDEPKAPVLKDEPKVPVLENAPLDVEDVGPEPVKPTKKEYPQKPVEPIKPNEITDIKLPELPTEPTKPVLPQKPEGIGDGKLTFDVVVTNYELVTYTKFKDPSGKDVEPPVEGIVGKKEIPGYTYKGTDKDKDGNIIHTYVGVKTFFKDPSGAGVIPPVDGIVGKKEIPGYTYKGTEKDKDGNIVHTYMKNEPKVKTFFKDPSGEGVIPPADGIVGAKEIPGYTYKGTEKDKDGNVIHTYTKNTLTDPNDGAKAGNGMDENGNPIKPPVLEVPEYTGVIAGNGLDGEGNVIEPPKVDVPEYTGDATEKSKEDPVEQQKVSKPKEQQSAQPKVKSEEHLDVKKTPSGKKLPETGDPMSFATLGLASLIGARRLRRKK